MDRVSETATRYLEMWTAQYNAVNDRDIVKYAVTSAMHDIECWCEGIDPNDAMESADVQDWTVEELKQLYSHLAPSASFFGYKSRVGLLTELDR